MRRCGLADYIRRFLQIFGGAAKDLSENLKRLHPKIGDW
jgi:hypothetical protein